MPDFIVFAVDAALVVIAFELFFLFVGTRTAARTPRFAAAIANLLAGAGLMAALRAALVLAPWPWIVAGLTGAGAMHLLELVLRRRTAT